MEACRLSRLLVGEGCSRRVACHGTDRAPLVPPRISVRIRLWYGRIRSADSSARFFSTCVTKGWADSDRNFAPSSTSILSQMSTGEGGAEPPFTTFWGSSPGCKSSLASGFATLLVRHLFKSPPPERFPTHVTLYCVSRRPGGTLGPIRRRVVNCAQRTDNLINVLQSGRSTAYLKHLDGISDSLRGSRFRVTKPFSNADKRHATRTLFPFIPFCRRLGLL